MLIGEHYTGLYQEILDWLGSQGSLISLDLFIENVIQLGRDARIPLNRTDICILKLLTVPSRYTRSSLGFPTYQEIGARIRKSQSTITRRMNHLETTSSINPFVLLNPSVFGFTTVGYFHTKSLTPQEEAYIVVGFPLPRRYPQDKFSILHLPPNSEGWTTNHQESIIKFSERTYGWNLTQLEPSSDESWIHPPSFVARDSISKHPGIIQSLTPAESPLLLNSLDVTLLDRLQVRGIENLESIASELSVSKNYLQQRFLRLQESKCFDPLVELWHLGLVGKCLFMVEGSSRQLQRMIDFIPLLPFSTAFIAEEALVAMVYLPSKWVLNLLLDIRELDHLDGMAAWVEMLDYRKIHWSYSLALANVWKGPKLPKNSEIELEEDNDLQSCWRPLK